MRPPKCLYERSVPLGFLDSLDSWTCNILHSVLWHHSACSSVHRQGTCVEDVSFHICHMWIGFEIVSDVRRMIYFDHLASIWRSSFDVVLWACPTELTDSLPTFCNSCLDIVSVCTIDSTLLAKLRKSLHVLVGSALSIRYSRTLSFVLWITKRKFDYFLLLGESTFLHQLFDSGHEL